MLVNSLDFAFRHRIFSHRRRHRGWQAPCLPAMTVRRPISRRL